LKGRTLNTNTEQAFANDKLAYSIESFARLAELSESTVKREIYAGNLKAVKKRSRVLIPVEAAREYLALKEEAQAGNQSLATTAPTHALIQS
jgi:hypothetical protein